MQSKNFNFPQGREILIKIDDEYISFYYADDIRRHKEWLSFQREQENEISDDEKEISEFYYIPKNEWRNDRSNRLDRGDNWHNHMKMKSWFTEDMFNFINQNC